LPPSKRARQLSFALEKQKAKSEAERNELRNDHDLDLLTAQVQIQLVVTGTTAEGVVDALNDAGSLELV
jgi:hypothetical protein